MGEVREIMKPTNCQPLKQTLIIIATLKIITDSLEQHVKKN